MTKPTKTKTKNTAKTNTPPLTGQLNAFAAEEDGNSASTVALLAPANFKKARPKIKKAPPKTNKTAKKRSGPTDQRSKIDEECKALFEAWDGEPFSPSDRLLDVETDSLESSIGYSSLYRQMHHAFLRRVAFTAAIGAAQCRPSRPARWPSTRAKTTRPWRRRSEI